MWLSKQTRQHLPTAEAELGVTTISGGSAGVMTKGEVRQLPVYGPGGYLWQPANGQTVLVIKGGTGAEESCVAGAKQDAAPEDMEPGDVYLHAGDASIYLKGDGSIRLQGAMRLEGEIAIEGLLVVNGKVYAPCTCKTEEGL